MSNEARKGRTGLANSGRSMLGEGACIIFVVVIGVLLITEESFSQGTINIGFEGPPFIPPSSDYSFEQYSEADLWFRPLGAVGPGNVFGRRGGGSSSPSFIPFNGTAYVVTALGESLAFSYPDGSTFDLHSVDLAEYSTVFPVPKTVHFIGYRHDGTIVTTDLTTDGVIDGTGPVPDFETFSFNAEFTALDRVEIPNPGWSMDNLVVTRNIPEPSSTAILLLAACLLFGASKPKRFL